MKKTPNQAAGTRPQNTTSTTPIPIPTPTPTPTPIPIPIPTHLLQPVWISSGPPVDNSFAHIYVGQHTGRPTSDAYYNYLNIGTENIRGLVNKDGSWTNLSIN